MSCEYWDEEIKTCRRSEVPKITLPEHIILDDLVSDEFKVVRAIDLPEPKIENRWIPVTERLPEEHTRVLVCDRTTVYMANLNDGWWYFSPAEIGMIVKQSDITAWMPLPEPWKGDEE